MALIHEKLYQSESLAQMDIRDYIQSLTANLFLSYGVGEDVIASKIHVENVPLEIDVLVPCALIINELVSNSLKHVFPASERRSSAPGEIRSIFAGRTAIDSAWRSAITALDSRRI